MGYAPPAFHNRVEGVGVANKEATELEFHQDTISGDGNSPLHLIREKEIEISGRILAAKRTADEIISEARREAVAIVSEAQGDASHLIEEHEATATAEMEKQSADVRQSAQNEVVELERSIEGKRREAVSFVVESVLGV